VRTEKTGEKRDAKGVRLHEISMGGGKKKKEDVSRRRKGLSLLGGGDRGGRAVKAGKGGARWKKRGGVVKGGKKEGRGGTVGLETTEKKRRGRKRETFELLFRREVDADSEKKKKTNAKRLPSASRKRKEPPMGRKKNRLSKKENKIERGKRDQGGDIAWGKGERRKEGVGQPRRCQKPLVDSDFKRWWARRRRVKSRTTRERGKSQKTSLAPQEKLPHKLRRQRDRRKTLSVEKAIGVSQGSGKKTG